jgi:hypothetical protein
MQRNHWLLLTIALLVVGNIAYYLWSNWGLITVHAKNQPLGEVIRSIEKQGKVTIKTNLDLAQPVQMDVHKVALAEALETLSVVTESRWRLAYFVAPEKGAIDSAVANMGSRLRPDGWRTMHVPLPDVGEHDVLPDPRKDPWAVQPAKEATLQAYLEQAARNVSASFLVPEQWNPAIASPPGAGAISKALPKLAKAANGIYQEIFVLQGFRMAEEDGRDRDRGRPNRDNNEGFRGFEAMEERIQNEIKKLPPAERAVAQKEHEERRNFFASMRDLTREEREAKMQEYMSDPKNQERMVQGEMSRDARRSPQQRMKRGGQYVQRMAQARGGNNP